MTDQVAARASPLVQTETVICIHGTFASPGQGHAQWYEPDSEFCSTLDRELERLGSSARCWGQEDDRELTVFSWSGANSWVDRYDAATRLADMMQDLRKRGQPYHIVAHSHGGNVVLEALQILGTRSIINRRADSWADGKIVLLGTPIIPTFRASPLIRTTRFYVYLLLSLIVLLVPNWSREGVITAWNWLSTLDVGSQWAAVTLSVMALSGMLAFGLFLNKIAIFFFPIRATRLLLMNSPDDEAWQLLSTLRDMADPIRESGQTFGAWCKSIPRLLARQTDLLFPRRNKHYELTLSLAIVIAIIATFTEQNIHYFKYLLLTVLAGGVVTLLFRPNTFFAILCWPARLIFATTTLSKSMIQYVASVFVRKNAWNYLRALAMGIDGYPYPVPQVLQKPNDLAEAFYTFRELSPVVLKDARSRRKIDVTQHTNEVLQMLRQGTAAATDLSQVFDRIAADISLVHASYYSHPEVIRKIAVWISAKPKTSSL